MIVEPPLLGATQVIVTLVFEFTEVVGASGTLGAVGSTAPLPEEDKAELPKLFVAST